MVDPTRRFSSRVANYARYRPSYPAAVTDLLGSECGLTADSMIVDVGSGTGILSELFLKNGNEVFGVEPNPEMRKTAEMLLKDYARFRSIDGTAESTGLDSNSMDFVTAGQAFHWFNAQRARAEFSRILKANGWAVLIWNERRLAATPFLRAYEEFLLKHGTDYEQVRHERVTSGIAGFFAPAVFRMKSFENGQQFNFESLSGRVFSASYTPEPGHPNYEPMVAELREIFAAHEKNGTVNIEYDVKIYYGRLNST